MSRKKPSAPAPAMASTGCSGLMSCLSIHRRGPPQPAPRGGEDAMPRSSDAERYRKRMQLLEEEIRRLSEWLGGQEERPAPPGAKAREEGTSSAAAECSRNRAKAGEVGCSAAAATATKRCASGVQDMLRLEDGSYLREVRRVRVGRPWERLAVQVSRPVVPVDAASASEVSSMSLVIVELCLRVIHSILPCFGLTNATPSPGS